MARLGRRGAPAEDSAARGGVGARRAAFFALAAGALRAPPGARPGPTVFPSPVGPGPVLPRLISLLLVPHKFHKLKATAEPYFSYPYSYGSYGTFLVNWSTKDSCLTFSFGR